ncbi:hypothetical protein [Bacillus sp. 1NLA3E]|uniref:hypothetical protein n=1 Tax=Bacillus sp. 1NLA3E TaxID=666686 RepID=UPI000247ED5E|nr:hypothetical protein [Bacillus sp. 1NLA3E]AGK55661.1 hypothetical protein B1NLA3E_19585 [Bacillus sp. 1NLA3E]
MKKIIFSILLMSMLFGMGGAVLASALDADQKAAIDNKVQQMIDKCSALMGGETADKSNLPPCCQTENPKECSVKGADKVLN